MWNAYRSEWMFKTRPQVFGQSAVEGDPDAERLPTISLGPLGLGVRVEDLAQFNSQGTEYRVTDLIAKDGVQIRLWSIFEEKDLVTSPTLRIVVLDQTAWESGLGEFLDGIESKKVGSADRIKEPWRGILLRRTGPLKFVAPRGVGPSAWPANKDAQIRRRFALLGQTLDGMRALDVLRSIELRGSPADWPLNITGVGQAAPVALMAAVFMRGDVKSVTLFDPPTTWRDGPAFLGIDRVMGLPQAAALLHPHPLTLIGTPREAWSWAEDLAGRLDPRLPWPTFRDRPRP
jgi:hypothetical protein